MTDGLEHLAYDLAAQALKKQEETLGDLRNRTGTLLLASSLVASFLGGRAIGAEGFSVLNILGGASYLATISLCVYLLAPKSHLEFVLDAQAADESFRAHGRDLASAYESLTDWLSAARERNVGRLRVLTFLFGLACAAFVPETLFWSVSLALH